MSVVEDLRKLTQDDLAPELSSNRARVDAMSKAAEAHHNELLSRIDSPKSSIGLDKRGHS